jgi:hypothetical protein
VPAEARLDPRHAGHRQRIIGPLTRHPIRGERHPQGVQNGLHDCDLRQVGALLLAVAKLEQASFTHRGVHAGAGTIDLHPCGSPVIYPHRMLMQGRLKGSPPRVITQAPQHTCEPVIGEIDSWEGVSGRRSQRVKSLGDPGFARHHAVVTPGQNRAEPDRAHPAQAETGPVAVGGKMGVSQRRQTHPLHLLKQQRNVVDALCDDSRYLMHAQSLAQSGIYLQIWANQESQSSSSLDGAMSKAKADANTMNLVVKLDDFDTNHWHFNTKGKLLDLDICHKRVGDHISALVPKQAYMISKLAGVAYHSVLGRPVN